MNSTDFAYAAGYIDGDGSFMIGNQSWGSSVVIVSIRKEPIYWFLDKFDGRIRAIKPKTTNRKISYHFRFSAKGLKSLNEISKFLIEKRQEFEIFNEFRNSFGKDLKITFIEKMKNLKEVEGLIPYSIKEDLTKIRNTIQPTKEDFAYLAGYIDAECSLDINKSNQKNGKTPVYRAQIQCNNTKAPFFYWVSARFGGQFHFLDKSHIKNCRNQMLWRISNIQLDPILQGILPFLTSKKPMCELMIELRKTTFKRTASMSPNHPDFSNWYESISSARKAIYDQVRHLNNTFKRANHFC